MAAVFQPPPTWAEPVVVDPRTQKATFNPVWLKWFIDLVGVINASGGGSGAVAHNSTTGLQGGSTNEYYHITSALFTSLSSIDGLLGGNGVPAAGLGVNGNFYFRYDGAAGTFIYHKAGGAWTAFA